MSDQIDRTDRRDGGAKKATAMTVHQVRRDLVSIDPRLAIVPMMVDVAAKFITSPKPEVKAQGVELMAEHDALRSSLDELGIVEPIKAFRQGDRWVLVDGRHRLEWLDDAAGEHENPEVPLIEVSEAEAVQIIKASVIGRRHWTKGQRAWLGVCQHPQVCAVKAEDSLKQNTARTDSIGAEVLTAPALASRLGVSADTVSQAVALYRAFYAPGQAASSPEAIEAAARREKYEHLIWGGAGLGGILAGIAGGDATGGKPKAQTGFHHLDAPLSQLVRLSKAFTGWGAEERFKAQRLLTARVKADMTPEFRLALAEALAAADD
jgi:ParB-like chromosome segregation protein Spo0J